MQNRNGATSGTKEETLIQSSQQDQDALHQSYHSGLAASAAYYAKQNLSPGDELTQKLLNAGFTREIENLYVDASGKINNKDNGTKLDFHFTTKFEEAFSVHMDKFPAEFTLSNFMNWMNTILFSFKNSALTLFSKDQMKLLVKDYPAYGDYILRNYFNFFLMRLMQSFSVLFADQRIQLVTYQAATNIIMGLVDCEVKVDPDEAVEWNIERITQSMIGSASLVATPWLSEKEQEVKEGICFRVNQLESNVPQGFEKEYEKAAGFFNAYRENNNIKNITMPGIIGRLVERNENNQSEKISLRIEHEVIKTLWGQLIVGSDAKLLPFNLQAAYLQRGVRALEGTATDKQPIFTDQLKTIQGFFELLMTAESVSILRPQELFLFYDFFAFLMESPSAGDIESYIENKIKNYANANALFRLDIKVFYALTNGCNIKSPGLRDSMAHWLREASQSDACEDPIPAIDLDPAIETAQLPLEALPTVDMLVQQRSRAVRFTQSIETRDLSAGGQTIGRPVAVPMKEAISERTKSIRALLKTLTTSLASYEEQHGRTQNISAMRSVLENAPNDDFSSCLDQCRQIAVIAKTRRDKTFKQPTLRSFSALSRSGSDRQKIYDALAPLESAGQGDVETTLAKALRQITKEKQKVRPLAFAELVAKGIKQLIAEHRPLKYEQLCQVVPIDKMYVDLSGGSHHLPGKISQYANVVFKHIVTDVEMFKLTMTKVDYNLFDDQLKKLLIKTASKKNASLSDSGRRLILEALTNPNDQLREKLSASYDKARSNTLVASIVSKAARTFIKCSDIKQYISRLLIDCSSQVSGSVDENLVSLNGWIKTTYREAESRSGFFSSQTQQPKVPDGLGCMSAIIDHNDFTSIQKREMIQAIACAKTQTVSMGRDSFVSKLYTMLASNDFDEAKNLLTQRQMSHHIS